ncbi:MAG: signal peptidase I [Blastochloris sp.]|nr:signal peptidase I [Blastochloris sp.]
MDETPLRRRLGMGDAPRATANDYIHADHIESIDTETDGGRPLPSVRGVVRELLETAIFVLLVFLIVRGVVQNFKIEGQSMEPNLHTNQYIFVNKIAYFHIDLNAPMRLLPGNETLPENIIYPFGAPDHGDVVVFEYPKDRSKDYIKRVIGLPGDSVAIRDGRVFVNDQLLDEPYIDEQTTCQVDDPCRSEAVTVPPNSIFVLGDNRPNSSDSREWGVLPYDRIIGKAWISYWPREHWSVITTPSYAAVP